MAAVEAAGTVRASPLARLMALVEQYPALQADDTVQRLTEELGTTENRIAFARQAFNDQVMGYNIELESFPAALIATLCGFRRASMLRATASEFVPNDDFFWTYGLMGQKLFEWTPPNGYPDVHDIWTGTNVMVYRWNIAYHLVAGNVDSTTIDILSLIHISEPTRPY